MLPYISPAAKYPIPTPRFYTFLQRAVPTANGDCTGEMASPSHESDSSNSSNSSSRVGVAGIAAAEMGCCYCCVVAAARPAASSTTAAAAVVAASQLTKTCSIRPKLLSTRSGIHSSTEPRHTASTRGGSKQFRTLEDLQ